MKNNAVVYFVLLLTMLSANVFSQNDSLLSNKDSITKEKPSAKVSVLIYERVILNSTGAVRTDQNFVGNFKLINWLKLEAGVRFGERPSAFDSYYQYKLELQSKSFWKIARVIARMSHNILNYPSPSYRKTNKLFAIEAKYPISKLFLVTGGVGYLFSSQQNKEPDALPTNMGVQNNYPIYKIGVRYMVKDKGFFEVAYGNYDVFNPYTLNAPFAQLLADIELSQLCTFYSYFRYQYINNVFTPNNYFFTVGVKFNLLRG